ncbi:MAG: tRNA (adenosine(37)-N6)-threonylcarbamoyltransferase complex ATPase subunit type 1 TsaE [Flavobacteriaceae bacterium]
MEIRFTLDEIDAVAAKIAPELKHRIVRMEGAMGAGKTTLIQALGRQLNLIDSVTSPTFSVVNTYLNKDQEIFYHFDFYRIESENETLDFGVEEYFDSGCWCFLEWSERIAKLLPDQYSTVTIEVLNEKTRYLQLSNS